MTRGLTRCSYSLKQKPKTRLPYLSLSPTWNSLIPSVSLTLRTMLTALKDSYNRPIRDLRVSLTDRCNFRCFYCLPHGEPPIAPKELMLSYVEIEYIYDIFVALGIEKIRLTDG